MIVENIIILPLLLTMAERRRGESGRWHHVIGQLLGRLAKNPMIIGLIAGLAISLSGWKLPDPVARTVNLFAMSSSALSLFVIGGTLVGLPMRGMGRQVIPIAAGKLLIHPLAVLSAILALPLIGLPAMDPSLRLAAILMAALPTMSIYPILGHAYGQEDLGAAGLLATTAVSFVTLSGLLWAFKHIPV